MNLKRKPYRPIPADPSIKCSYCLMEKNMVLPIGKTEICDRHIIPFKHNRQKFRAESRQRADGDMIDLDAEQDLIMKEAHEQDIRDFPNRR